MEKTEPNCLEFSGSYQEIETPIFCEEAKSKPENPIKTELYNEAYRHFDPLIWQVPAWSSALFAAIIATIGAVFGIDSESMFFSEFISQKLLV